jgi:hypothetical protein
MNSCSSIVRVGRPADCVQPALYAVKVSRRRQLVSDFGDGRADIGSIEVQLAATGQMRGYWATSSSDNRRRSSASSGM